MTRYELASMRPWMRPFFEAMERIAAMTQEEDLVHASSNVLTRAPWCDRQRRGGAGAWRWSQTFAGTTCVACLQVAARCGRIAASERLRELTSAGVGGRGDLFPHICPRCGAPAYVGFSSVECSRCR